MKYLYPHQIIYLHKRIVEASGGASGVRDIGLLESAVYRPQASFGGTDLYPDLFSKTAALGYSLIKNHPFLDGNKRTGFEAMRLLLRLNGMDLKATERQKFKFVLEIASDLAMNERAIAQWLEERALKRG